MLTVLIVDDDAPIRATLRAAMEEAGHTVAEATNGAEALATLRATATPMVVLLDLRMPEVSGFEVLAQVEQDYALARRHAFVVLSADGASLPVVRALRSKTVVTALPKPFELDVLLASVDEAARAHADGAAVPDAGDDPRRTSVRD
jgi:CheY-like chemotaxis protein